tara:strand:- start:479 stop:652 length:174 start_codon:yes stop_codon:yes gene_type:complete
VAGFVKKKDEVFLRLCYQLQIIKQVPAIVFLFIGELDKARHTIYSAYDANVIKPIIY